MNTHKRNPSYKLTMISIWHMGQRMTKFLHLPVGEDGKVKIDMEALIKSLPQIQPGDTFAIGA